MVDHSSKSHSMLFTFVIPMVGSKVFRTHQKYLGRVITNYFPNTDIPSLHGAMNGIFRAICATSAFLMNSSRNCNVAGLSHSGKDSGSVGLCRLCLLAWQELARVAEWTY